MTVFLDAHVLFWAIYIPERLSEYVRALIRTRKTVRLVSEATQWEMLNKVGRGKVPFSGSSVPDVAQRIRDLEVSFVPILQEDTIAAAMLPYHHSDPFDRVLIAQSQRLDVPIITVDEKFAAYGVPTIW